MTEKLKRNCKKSEIATSGRLRSTIKVNAGMDRISELPVIRPMDIRPWCSGRIPEILQMRASEFDFLPDTGYLADAWIIGVRYPVGRMLNSIQYPAGYRK